jgi:hypothetical protein
MKVVKRLAIIFVWIAFFILAAPSLIATTFWGLYCLVRWVITGKGVDADNIPANVLFNVFDKTIKKLED